MIDAKDDYSDLRWTVDTEKDLKLVREIAGHFEDRINFSWMEILDVYHQIPALKKINNDVNQNSALDVDDRLI